MFRRPKRRGLPRSAIRKHNRKRKRSSLEILVAEWLTGDKVEFRQEYTIGRCHCDFYVAPKLVVEVNGCYWHGCQKCYPQPTRRQKRCLYKDSRRYKFFKYKGFQLLILWECELLEHPRRARSLLRKRIRDARDVDPGDLAGDFGVVVDRVPVDAVRAPEAS